MIQLIPGIQSTASALNAERIRMEVVSQNIANANTTRGLDGKPFQRRQVVFENVLANHQQGDLPGSGVQTVRVARIEKDVRPPRQIYSPGHPDANPKTGMVEVPDINIHEEMADMITSSRAFEANLAVAKTSRNLAQQTLSIGRR
jgi:flagellar basal-body rod protein FlgC